MKGWQCEAIFLDGEIRTGMGFELGERENGIFRDILLLYVHLIYSTIKA